MIIERTAKGYCIRCGTDVRNYHGLTREAAIKLFKATYLKGRKI